jgi:DNA ligase-1
VLIRDLVAASTAVASTRSRRAKVDALAALLARTPPDETEAAVAFLSGEARQGRVGVGWATIRDIPAGLAAEPTVTVQELDETIERVRSLGGPGSTAARRAELGALLGRTTREEAEFVRHLLLGDLRQGALAGVMADAVASAARVPVAAVRRAAMLDGNLPRVACVAMRDGAVGLASIGLDLLRPVQPMLASSASSPADAVAALGVSSVVWKLDGARIQAHRSGDEVRLFTRNLNDVTERLPGVVEVVRMLPVREAVLDGEVLGIGDGDRPDLFQQTMSRFGQHRGGGAELGAWFFDALHVDGDDLLDRPLADRIAVLTEIAGPWRVPSVLTDDPDRAAAFLDEALASGHEGVMVKAAGSTYEAGRRGQAWRKVKPVRTLDLVVLAAEWGHGRRRGWLSNLHLGARGEAGAFVMVGKTFKGLTDELLAWQTGALLERRVAEHGITVEVRPELVVEIALDGVQVSTRYPGGVALRFARVRRYRADKTPAEADSIDAVRALLPAAR